MKRLYKLIGSAICIAMLWSSAVVAQGVPVIDSRNLAENLRQIAHMAKDLGVQNEQLDALIEQVALAEKELAKLEEVYDALSGKTDIVELLMGGDLDAVLGQEFTDFRLTMNAVRRGDLSSLTGNGSPYVHKTIQEVLDDHGFSKEAMAEVETNGTDEQKLVTGKAASSAVMSGAAQNSYKEAGLSLDRIEQLVDKTADFDTLKESLDHNTRVTAELGVALIKLWELEAVQVVGDSSVGVADAATIASEQQFFDFTLPNLD